MYSLFSWENVGGVSLSRILYEHVSKRSAIAEKARVFLVNSDHGIVENQFYADSMNFYGTMTLWRPCLNPAVAGRFGTPLPEFSS